MPSDQHKPETITPVTHRPPEQQAPPRAVAQAPFFWPAVALITLLLCLVVFWLPSQIPERSLPSVTNMPVSSPAQPAERAELANAQPEPALDTEETLARRQKAQRIADALQLRRAELEKLAVERWASADYQQVVVNDERAADYFGNREFDAAATYWQKALGQASTLLGQVESVLKSTVVQGYDALEKLNSEEATKAFDLALAIHPENALARIGLQRAQNLPQILTLMAAAENHERQDQLDQAMMLYREVLRLDPQSAAAKEGMQRLAKAMQDWEFRITLSTAQQALDAGDYAAAKREFQKANAIKKNDPAVVEGLAQTERGLLQAEIARLKQRAEQATVAEDWGTAVSHYQRIVKLDNTLAFAHDGLARSRERQSLDARVQALIDEPDRLFSNAVLDSAKKLLRDAQAVPGPGRKLQAQIIALQEAIARADTDVRVSLLSDNVTSVMVYRVGRLGQFERKELLLSPGDYVIVGRCEGYRDARKTVTVPAGIERFGPIDIRCTEKL